MTELKRRLEEDRALRDAARSIILGQLLRVRQAASGQRMGTELADKVGDHASGLIKGVSTVARKNGGLIAAIAGIAGAAAALWFWREPIESMLRGLIGDGYDTDEDSELSESLDDAETSSRKATSQAGD